MRKEKYSQRSANRTSLARIAERRLLSKRPIRRTTISTGPKSTTTTNPEPAAWYGDLQVLYINLASRTDRRQQLESELNRVGIPADRIERLDAIVGPTGQAGAALACSTMHLKAVERAKQIGRPFTVIFEDDFQFIDDVDRIRRTIQNALARPTWNVLMLSSTTYDRGSVWPDLTDDWTRVSNAQGCEAYVLRRDYLDRMIDCWRESVTKLASTGQHWNYMSDQAWKALQSKDNWILPRPTLGCQRPSFSDLAGRFVDYATMANDKPKP